MKIYLISQTERTGYDTYDSAVVIARNAKEARHTNPSNGLKMTLADWNPSYSVWCGTPDAVTVQCLGTAALGAKHGVVCASFNAG